MASGLSYSIVNVGAVTVLDTVGPPSTPLLQLLLHVAGAAGVLLWGPSLFKATHGKVLLLVGELLCVRQILPLGHVPHLPSWQGGGHEHHQPQLVLDDAAYIWCSKCIQNLDSVVLLTYRDSLSIFESFSKQVTITCYPMKGMKCSSTWTKSFIFVEIF